LILGSEGFIGLHIIQKGLEKGYEVFGCDIIKHSILEYKFFNISVDSVEFRNLLVAETFYCIINCSGSGNVTFSLDYPLMDFQMNVSNVLYILESIRLNQIATKYIHLSSAAVYGNPELLPINETSLINPISPYGFHKYQSEILCKEYAQLYDMNISIVRPFSVYGPGLRKQIIWDTYVKGKKDKIIELSGTGNETRDFIYIDDLIESLFHIAEFKFDSIEIFNIATGNEISINHLLQKLLGHLGWNNILHFNQLVREGDPKFWKADISKLSSLGFQCKHTIDFGLSETANWLNDYA
jgi:UDP-glucose 4-epimerase